MNTGWRAIRVALCLLALLAGTAQARNFKATIVFSPDPAIGVESAVSGCGYDPNAEVTIKYLWNVDFNKHTNNWQMIKHKPYSNSSGCFYDTFTPIEAGLYEIWTTQNNNSKQDIDQAKSMITFTLY